MDKTEKRIKLALTNITEDAARLKALAGAKGFAGVDWSIRALPETPGDESSLKEKISLLEPLEVRYHVALENTDLGDFHRESADRALKALLRVCRLVSSLGGRFVTNPRGVRPRLHPGSLLGEDH